MGSEIEVFDLKRIFLGDVSAWFLLEVVFRTSFMFVYTLILVRTAGKRGIGDVSPFELLLVVALGSAVGDPMFYPEVPLLHAMVVVAVVVLLQRGLVTLNKRSARAERLLESTSTRLVTNGVIELDAMAAERFARDELFMALRENSVEQLGQVKRAYLEPSGRISAWLFAKEDVLPGLPLIPDDDPEYPVQLSPGDSTGEATTLACVTCGTTIEAAASVALAACPACTSEDGWIPASSEPGAPGPGADGGGRRRRPRGPFGN